MVFKGEPIELEAVFVTLEPDETLAFNKIHRWAPLMLPLRTAIGY